MIHSGLVSITFRQLSPQEIVTLVAEAGLEGIEWGGDVHVPHGEPATAREVARITRDAGLAVAAYGSYYRVGHDEPAPFEAVLDTAAELGAPLVRVWAGKVASEEADEAHWNNVVAESRRIADLAARRDVVVAYEFHSGTLTDTNDSARRLLETAAHDNVKTYWQPPPAHCPQMCVAGIRAVAPWLAHVHVYAWNWDGKNYTRLPMSEGAENWAGYLREIGAVDGVRFAMIEFVKDDEPANFLADAATLRNWLAELS